MSDEEAAGPTLPQGVLRPKGRGWAGEEMELNRSVNEQDSVIRQCAAVDKSEFYNTEVGSGYQAKHVVRQRQADGAKVEIIDMSGKDIQSKDSRKKHKRDKNECKGSNERKHKKSRSIKVTSKVDERSQKSVLNVRNSLLNEMLQCDAMREFKIEVAKILRSDR